MFVSLLHKKIFDSEGTRNSNLTDVPEGFTEFEKLLCRRLAATSSYDETFKKIFAFSQTNITKYYFLNLILEREPFSAKISRYSKMIKIYCKST